MGVVFALYTPAQSASAIPSISKLTSWTGMNRPAFDSDIRRFGFTFEERREEEKSTDYVYVRNFSAGRFIHTERINYRVWDADSSVILVFHSTRDLITHYQPQLRASHFSTTRCSEEPDANETTFCYLNSLFFLKLGDRRVKEEENTRNSYRVLLFRR